MLKIPVGVERTQLSSRRDGHSHQLGTLLIFIRAWTLQQVIFMLLQNGAERTPDLFELEHGDSKFFKSLGLPFKKNGELSICSIVDDRNLYEAFGTALDVLRDRRVWTSGGCSLRIG